MMLQHDQKLQRRHDRGSHGPARCHADDVADCTAAAWLHMPQWSHIGSLLLTLNVHPHVNAIQCVVKASASSFNRQCELQTGNVTESGVVAQTVSPGQEAHLLASRSARPSFSDMHIKFSTELKSSCSSSGCFSRL